MDSRIEWLLGRGVCISKPESIEIGPEVDLDRIAEGVVLNPGCRIRGRHTAILENARLGEEGPVTIDDCQVGPAVELKGGYFRQSVFLEKSVFGSGAQVREACLLEEEANAAHAVGIKQTILFPFVTLGSLINFCDILMAGGTSRRDHSEVGSSYIHFNYTPNQDKATASLIGDVPRGVMLRERPIFLGGQGGLVGPSAIGYGSVIAAGIVYRGDLAEGRLVVGDGGQRKEMAFLAGVYFEIERKIRKNLRYIGNLVALRQWYLDVRRRFFPAGPFGQSLQAGAAGVFEKALDERLARLRALAGFMPESIRTCRSAAAGKASPQLLAQKEEFHQNWPAVEESLRSSLTCSGAERSRAAFLSALEKSVRSSYLESIRGLDDNTASAGSAWLQGIVNTVAAGALRLLPSLCC